jgi:hypothetical protein
MRNSHAIGYKRAYPLAYVLILSGIFGLFSGCGGESWTREPLPEVNGCEYDVSRDSLSPAILICDEVHDLGAVSSDRWIEIRVRETAEATHLNLSGFSNLATLKIDNGNIKALDLSRNSDLHDVELDMPGLVDLRLPAIQIGTVSLRNMPMLTELDTSGMRINRLILGGNLGFDVKSLLSHTEIWDLALSQLDLTEINLAQLVNLEALSLFDCEFQDLNWPTQLRELWISGGGTTELDLSGGRVRRVTLTSTAIQSLRLSEYEFGLIQVTNHNAEALKISGENSATTLKITGGKIEHLDLRENNTLKELSIIDTLAVKQIILPFDAPLVEIDLKNLSLRELDIPSYETLKRIDIQYVPLTDLNAGILDNLSELNLVGTTLTEIPLSTMPNLSTLQIAEHKLSGLDLSGNRNITYLGLLDVRGFTEVDLPHLGLVYLSIVDSDLSCDSLQQIADQFSGLWQGGYLHLPDLDRC